MTVYIPSLYLTMKVALVGVYIIGLVALISSCENAKSLTTKKAWKFIFFPLCVVPACVSFVTRVLNFLLAAVLLLIGIRYAHSYLYERISTKLDDVVYKNIF